MSRMRLLVLFTLLFAVCAAHSQPLFDYVNKPEPTFWASE